MNLTTKRILIGIGFGLFATATSFWIETAIGELDEVTRLLIIVPIIEESMKMLGYKALRGAATICIPIIFILAESVFSIVGSANVRPELLILAFPYSLFLLKHLIFWGFGKVWDFSWWTQALMIAAHSLWNAYYLYAPNQALAYAVFLSCIPFGIVMYREAKNASIKS